MRNTRIVAALAVSSFLAGCGGGSDGGVQGPGSTPAPPPSNSTITSLIASQSFTNDDAVTTVVLALPEGAASGASASKSTLSISYDASSKSYTVSTGGRSQTFAPSDQTTSNSNGPGITAFQKSANGTSDYLTLVTTPFDTSVSNRYVGLGFWQRNQIASGQQNTTFDLFTYGLDTPAGAVPRSGSASFAIDAFGFYTMPGTTPQTLQGTGTFDVDLKSGVFAANAMMKTWDVVTGKPMVTGYGSVPLQAGGHLSSTDGSFSGNLSFSNSTTSGYEPVSGSIDGHFYGPSGQELGATFAASGALGATLNGGFTGQQNNSGPGHNLTLANLTTSQTFFLQTPTMVSSTDSHPGSNIDTVSGTLQLAADGSFSFAQGLLFYDPINWDASKQVVGAPNFTTYHTVVNGNPVDVAMYKPGSANSELPLTYASFGLWRETGDSTSPSEIHEAFFAYGIKTTDGVLINRTGSGHYVGVAYGSAFDSSVAAHYALAGTSSFDVNFSSQSYSGALALKGAQDGTGVSRDFGSFGISGSMNSDGSGTGSLTQAGTAIGQFASQFYGPNGEELAGTFTARTGTVDMAGVAAAKAH